MKFFLILSLMFYASFTVAEEVYKTVDEDGNIIFTDKPTEGSEKVILRELKTIDNPNPAKYRPLPDKPENVDPGDIYGTLLITNPANGSGLRNNAGNVSISVSVEPSLRPGHKLIITMDGKEISNGAATSTSLTNVDRGTHSLVARVVDANGNTIKSTSSSFSLLRAHR